jgi:hypothetical protein
VVEFDILEINDGEAVEMQLGGNRLFDFGQAEMREFDVEGR